MSKKNKTFKDWNSDSEWDDPEDYTRRDSKRYDGKKDAIKQARERKQKRNDSFFDVEPNA